MTDLDIHRRIRAALTQVPEPGPFPQAQARVMVQFLVS